MPNWKRISSSVSYSNLLGRTTSPITGGLFIKGGEAIELRDTVAEFPITQDQRNTVAGQIRIEPHRRLWLTFDARYGSGLPVELQEEENDEDGEEEEGESSTPISPEILRRINFDRGRIRPNFSLNLSSGIRLWEQDSRSASLQLDVRNVTDRLNVINFSGAFSGTALAPGRQVVLQMRVRY